VQGLAQGKANLRQKHIKNRVSLVVRGILYRKVGIKTERHIYLPKSRPFCLQGSVTGGGGFFRSQMKLCEANKIRRLQRDPRGTPEATEVAGLP